MARRRGRRVPKATRDSEYALLLEHAPSELYCDLFVAMRWAGLRVSEAVALRWDSVDLAQLQLSITGKGGVERTIDILPEMEAMLRRRLSDLNQIRNATCRDEVQHFETECDTSPYVFPHRGGPLTTRAVQRVVQRIRDKLGLPETRLTPHKLRHAYATDLVSRGVPIHVVSAQLGHASVATTSIYLHAQPGQARRYFEDV
jgi:site-specific recombinase XerD